MSTRTDYASPVAGETFQLSPSSKMIATLHAAGVIQWRFKMKIHSNGWYDSHEFPKVADVIHRVASTEHTRWLGHINVKYLMIKVDQRTGDFIILDSDNNKLTHEQLCELFPEFKDKVVKGSENES